MPIESWGRRLAASGLCALAWSGAAIADDGATPAASAARAVEHRREPAGGREAIPAACAAPPAHAAATLEQEVAELYRQFECRFLEQRYADGLPYLERACALKNSPRCLLNLAAVHHGLMHCELARSYYFRYLDVVPYDEASESALDALAELEGSCGMPADAVTAAPPAASNSPLAADSIAPLPAAAPTPNPPAARASLPVTVVAPARTIATNALAPRVAMGDESIERKLGLWLLGAGAASGAGAVIALLYGARIEHDAERRDRSNGGLGASDDPELQAIDRAGRRSNRLAAALGIGSGVLAGAGVTLWLASSSSGASVEVGADGAASLGYRGAF
jgi:hypothetical protein